MWPLREPVPLVRGPSQLPLWVLSPSQGVFPKAWYMLRTPVSVPLPTLALILHCWTLYHFDVLPSQQARDQVPECWAEMVFLVPHLLVLPMQGIQFLSLSSVFSLLTRCYNWKCSIDFLNSVWLWLWSSSALCYCLSLMGKNSLHCTNLPGGDPGLPPILLVKFLF